MSKRTAAQEASSYQQDVTPDRLARRLVAEQQTHAGGTQFRQFQGTPAQRERYARQQAVNRVVAEAYRMRNQARDRYSWRLDDTRAGLAAADLDDYRFESDRIAIRAARDDALWEDHVEASTEWWALDAHEVVDWDGEDAFWNLYERDAEGNIIGMKPYSEWQSILDGLYGRLGDEMPNRFDYSGWDGQYMDDFNDPGIDDPDDPGEQMARDEWQQRPRTVNPLDDTGRHTFLPRTGLPQDAWRETIANTTVEDSAAYENLYHRHAFEELQRESAEWQWKRARRVRFDVPETPMEQWERESEETLARLHQEGQAYNAAQAERRRAAAAAAAQQ